MSFRFHGVLWIVALTSCSRAIDETLEEGIELPALRWPVGSGDEPEALMPRPARLRLDEAVSDNAACVACHLDEAHDWYGSLHQRSNVDAAYRAAFASEPEPFCRSCHAPEADPRTPPDEAVSALGVACVSCHVTEPGVVLAADHGSQDTASAPHPLRRSRAFAASGACAGCHEFRFPLRSGESDGDFMQRSVREHRDSAGAEQGCADCHMPRVEGRRSHSFANVRDAVWLRQNLEAEARVEADAVVITMRQPRPGHAFPTGDLFRRLEVGAELVSEEGVVVAHAVRHLARRFEVQVGLQGRQLVRDDRVFDEPRRVRLELEPVGDAAGLTLRWWVRLQRVASVGAGHTPETAVVESSVPLHAGERAWRARP